MTHTLQLHPALSQCLPSGCIASSLEEFKSVKKATSVAKFRAVLDDGVDARTSIPVSQYGETLCDDSERPLNDAWSVASPQETFSSCERENHNGNWHLAGSTAPVDRHFGT